MTNPHAMESKRCTEDCTRCSGEFCERHGTNPCDCDVIDRHTVEAVEAFNTQSPHWGSMVSPVAQIVRVKRCEHCGTAPAEVGPLCMMCEDDRREKYGI